MSGKEFEALWVPGTTSLPSCDFEGTADIHFWQGDPIPESVSSLEDHEGINNLGQAAHGILGNSKLAQNIVEVPFFPLTVIAWP